ncbi:hypothetical protein EOE18_05365 [Novosphingobium umbonatum]|uniref:Uncharacterized protein n=1 Tax=Novosphingobium umbonatum TaxID=1908524 RepID=A0A3S2UVN3_9SPHN|nr:hypothetical protein [Novosphingobium umbonatum]RVU06264.1 hypothetical protein EOE18_05365 [Novosphingobium umbonatum]
MTHHGGARRGAGRPRKWRFDDVLKVGQACEVAWRDAVANAFEAEKVRFFRTESDIQSLWDAAQRVPVSQRLQWYDDDEGETHRADIETELHALNETPDNPDPPPRITRIMTRPPRGTRRRIIAEIAERFGLPESVVDNLWQAYRRFERELSESQDSGET